MLNEESHGAPSIRKLIAGSLFKCDKLSSFNTQITGIVILIFDDSVHTVHPGPKSYCVSIKTNRGLIIGDNH